MLTTGPELPGNFTGTAVSRSSPSGPLTGNECYWSGLTHRDTEAQRWNDLSEVIGCLGKHRDSNAAVRLGRRGTTPLQWCLWGVQINGKLCISS